MANIYSSTTFMEHNSHPDYKYEMDAPTHSHEGINPSCGDELTLQVTVSPDGASNDSVSYASSDEDVAIVDGSGKVTFLSEGQVTITAASADDPSKTDSFTITVDGVVSAFLVCLDQTVDCFSSVITKVASLGLIM